MSNKQVSIVIPTKNRAEYLKTCIESCLKQTQSCEVIVCDHGSTDNTPEIAASFESKIVYIRKEQDFGPHYCWLDGVLHAKNEWVHINFDDDWIEPSFIEKTAALISDEVGCVFSDAKIFFELDNSYSQPMFKFSNKTGLLRSSILEKSNFDYVTSPCAAIFRKHILINNLFVGDLPFARTKYHGVGSDILFSLFSSLEYSYFGFVNEPLCVFRAHENSITIDAKANDKKKILLKNAYKDAINYYKVSKMIYRFRNSLFLKILFKIYI